MKRDITIACLACLLGTASLMAQESTPAKKEVRILGPLDTPVKMGDEITAAKIITKVQPGYPPLARQTKISGVVKLRVIINKEGSVQQLELISGHPLLVQAAMDAVRQWKYKPTLLNGKPVAIETTVDVTFSLNGNPPQNPAKAQSQPTK